jgi:predicted MPP superfamily phosphohydrolase
MRSYGSGSFSTVLSRAGQLLDQIHVQDGVYAVLGNHDCLELAFLLEGKGIIFLINDAVSIERNGEVIWIVGVDDPHYYETHDLEKAFKDVPPGAFSIFTAHSPEVYKDAVKYGPQLYLCGHTHAGQIQAPWIGPVFTHSKTPRHYTSGEWEYDGMIGYTSAGVGVSGVPVRYGCRGEVVYITLKKGAPAPSSETLS